MVFKATRKKPNTFLSNIVSREFLDNVAAEKNTHMFVNMLFKNISSVENALKRIMPVRDESTESYERQISEVTLVCNPKAKFKARSSFDSGTLGGCVYPGKDCKKQRCRFTAHFQNYKKWKMLPHIY